MGGAIGNVWGTFTVWTQTEKIKQTSPFKKTSLKRADSTVPAWDPAPLCKFDQKEPSFTVPVQTPLRGSRPVCCFQRLCCLKNQWGLRFRSHWGREPEPSVNRSQGPLPSVFWLHPEARRWLEIAQTCSLIGSAQRTVWRVLLLQLPQAGH